ncbi:MAG TPA: amidohydrolase family protein, partial [Chitinophagales bacterium]|nr:amidohydrolase family protein [Chitinophagales bacterium]
ISEKTEGKDLAEMYDMHSAGAIAFSDGIKASANAGMVERSLLYVKAFDGLIMNHPEEKSLSKNGAMHEGLTSTKLGLPGAPALAEEVSVNRDIYILEYTGSKLHLLDISLKRSVDMIRQAKKKGLRLSSSVNAYNLLLEETAVGNYNTNYKVNPHLRSKEDINALVKGIADGTIDTITSSHQPHDEECKKLEFDKADFGMIGLETCFAAANTALTGKVELQTIVNTLANNPRRILGLENKIEEGALADLTLFNPGVKWTFEAGDIKSKSKNTPFAGTTFIGKALGVINKGKIQLN